MCYLYSMDGRVRRRRRSVLMVFVAASLLFSPCVSPSQEIAPPEAPEPADKEQRIDLEFEPDAYYTSLGLFFALTREPIPRMGERAESEIYAALLARSLAPRFLVLEASVNPLPYLGTTVKKHHREFYDDAEISGSFNWIKALTAGFEEPWAASAFVGNVVDFDVQGRKDVAGKGYAGFLASAGNYHIKDNELIQDDWRELEWKIKGDRKSPRRKLNWSFRVGAKLHGNPDITDVVYLSVRRSRVDYRPDGPSIFNNSGFEYTFDMDRRGLDAIRHYFFVDKKWPWPGRKIAFSLALGLVWESAKKYSGQLAAGRESDDLQAIIRPNIEF
jgi:hypothetical protein